MTARGHLAALLGALLLATPAAAQAATSTSTPPSSRGRPLPTICGGGASGGGELPHVLPGPSTPPRKPPPAGDPPQLAAPSGRWVGTSGATPGTGGGCGNGNTTEAPAAGEGGAASRTDVVVIVVRADGATAAGEPALLVDAAGRIVCATRVDADGVLVIPRVEAADLLLPAAGLLLAAHDAASCVLVLPH